MKPKSSHGLRIGIVNPTTLVGSELKLLLHERGIPYAHLSLIDTTGTTEGAITEVGDEPALVAAVSEDSFEDLDLVFFCGNGEANRSWIERRKVDRFLAVDLSQPSSFDREGARIIAGVNSDDLPAELDLVVSPHPIAVSIALLVHALVSAITIRLAAVSVIQPASELGQAGVDELYQQTIGSLNMQSIPKTVFDRQLAFNLYPAGGGSEVESYVRNQLGSVVPDTPIALSILQGTIFHGHSLALFIQAEKEVDEKKIRDVLAADPAILLGDDDDVTVLDAAGKDQILVGRVSVDPKLKNGFWIWAAADNLRRSSALNAVLVAEAIIGKSGLVN